MNHSINSFMNENVGFHIPASLSRSANLSSSSPNQFSFSVVYLPASKSLPQSYIPIYSSVASADIISFMSASAAADNV